MNTIKIYNVPEEIPRTNKYNIKVRTDKNDLWKNIDTYEVTVDMHEVRSASMAYFDFCGSAEIEIEVDISYIYKVDIRPVSKNIDFRFDSKKIYITLQKPENLSIEVNSDRFHNLHLFAGQIMEYMPCKDNTLIMTNKIGDVSFYEQIAAMPDGRTLIFEEGIYYFTEILFKVQSNTNIILKGGAVIVGGFVFENCENVSITGRGVIYQADFKWYTSINAVRISHSKNIKIDGVTIINPPHYSVYIGGSDNISINNVKIFSSSKWTDGIDMMSSRNILIDNCFIRTSDDCIAIYGRRWGYNGDVHDIVVKNTSLWADVAHPTIIGTHGDYENNGNIIENIKFENIDILEHHEYQANYLGCLAINVGDKNTVRNVEYKNIRIEQFEHGKVFDFRVFCNKDYNPAPGSGIENITLDNISYNGNGAEKSEICGYDSNRMVKNVKIRSLRINGQLLQGDDMKINEYTDNIVFEE